MTWLDKDIVKEYDEAIEFDADMVRRETDVPAFLKAEDYHTLRTAKRIAMRWKVRKQIFGTERWLLPMIGTGKGALPPCTVELLRTGYDMVAFPSKEANTGTNKNTAMTPVYLIIDLDYPVEPSEWIRFSSSRLVFT